MVSFIPRSVLELVFSGGKPSSKRPSSCRDRPTFQCTIWKLGTSALCFISCIFWRPSLDSLWILLVCPFFSGISSRLRSGPTLIRRTLYGEGTFYSECLCLILQRENGASMAQEQHGAFVFIASVFSRPCAKLDEVNFNIIKYLQFNWISCLDQGSHSKLYLPTVLFEK